MKLMFAAAAILLLADVAGAHPEASHDESATKVGAVTPSARSAAAVVDAFHAALQRGETKAALSYLAADALIYEAGGVERGLVFDHEDATVDQLGECRHWIG